MIYVGVIFLSLIVVISGQDCPSCDQVECITTLGQDTCARSNIFSMGTGLCGCCPGCSALSLFTGFNKYGCSVKPCAPGLLCEAGTCRINRKKCLHLYYIQSLYKSVPECDKAGEIFKAIQCKGDRASGRCFCFSETGDRLFGWDWRRNVEDMTCSCTQKRYKKERKGEISTLHCTQNGNFEELQCEDDICWCADTKTGDLQEGNIAVPYDMWKLLPCYNVTQMGTSYLRQCESVVNAQETMKRKFTLHGAKSISMRNVLCDYDGSYGIYAISSGIASCTWRDGSKIGAYQVPASLALAMNCNCARDSKIFEEHGFVLTLQCTGNGNYDSLQDENQQSFCVDSDGFAISDLIPSTPLPDCNIYMYNKYVDPEPT